MKLTARHVVGGAGILAVLSIATPLVGGFEGLRLHVYPDPATRSAPWTYCYGETVNPKFGHVYTEAECDETLSMSLAIYDHALRACVPAPLPTKVEAAFLSTAYNIGVSGFCHSSIATNANAGKLTEACNRLPLFNRAVGKVMPGLTVRRGAEQALCLEGVAEGLPK